jgi:hypothetical protein
MDKLYNRDELSFKIDNKIKYLCNEDEKIALTEMLNYLKTLLNEKKIMDYQIDEINKEIEKILLYNI